MKSYKQLLTHTLTAGEERGDRTGTGTISVFGASLRHNFADGFPLLTTKKLHLKSVIHELLWMLSGDTNTLYLAVAGVRIWDEWADENGNLGPIYGKQWRDWSGPQGQSIDQIKELIHGLIHNPDSRRHIVTAWNPSDVNTMALPPCHCFFQFYVHADTGTGKRGLSCQLYQRSADIFLGVPFNIASYALLTMMIAQVCDYTPVSFIHTFGDLHLYNNHRKQALLQLSRDPLPLPTMHIDPTIKNIDDFRYDHFTLNHYQHHPRIKAEVSV